MGQAGKERGGASQSGMMGSTGSAPVLIQQALVMGQAGTGEGHVEEVEGSRAVPLSSSSRCCRWGRRGKGREGQIEEVEGSMSSSPVSMQQVQREGANRVRGG